MNASDRETLRRFYVCSRQQLYTYAVALTADRAAAEDAIQAAFQNLLTRDDLPADLRPYVFRCVRNAAIDARRRAHRTDDSIFAPPEPIDESPAPGPPLQPDEIDRCLRALSADEREAIVLKIYDGFSFQEIADLRSVPLPTAASWYRRGLDKLKALLAPDFR